jgi:hypothetical protein
MSESRSQEGSREVKAREGGTRGCHDGLPALGGRECVAETVVVRASSEVDVTKFVRGCWLGQRSVQSRKGKQRVLRWQSGDGLANRKRQHIGSENAKLLVNVRKAAFARRSTTA